MSEIKYDWVKKQVWEIADKKPDSKDAWMTKALTGKTSISNAQDVFVVQSALVSLWYKPWKIDGIFRTPAQQKSWVDSNTMKAVREFQRNNKLNPDGQVWEKTIAKLIDQLTNCEILPVVTGKPNNEGIKTVIKPAPVIPPVAVLAQQPVQSEWIKKH